MGEHKLKKEKPVSIYIATPMYGGQCLGTYTHSCLELQKLADQHRVPIQFSFLFNESLVHRGRNELVAKFLQTDHSHLMFIDADIGFNPMDVMRLVAANKDVIGGTYPRKKINWQNVKAAIMTDPNVPEALLEKFAADFIFKTLEDKPFETNKPVACQHIPTGFMCIKREVIEKLAEGKSYVENNVPDGLPAETRYLVFDTGINDKNEFLSEDFWFCDLAIKAGFGVWLLPDIELTHTGSYKFQGSMSLIASYMNKG